MAGLDQNYDFGLYQKFRVTGLKVKADADEKNFEIV